MRLALLAVGRMKAGPESELVRRYAERIEASGRSLGLSPFAMSEIPEARDRRAEDRKASEAAALLAQVPDGAMIVFDERGKALSSEDFAAQIGGWRDSGRAASSFVIGGADGLDRSLRERADLVLSFGAMTMPHQIVRILAAEQIYRAMTILAGHPYHRA